MKNFNILNFSNEKNNVVFKPIFTVSKKYDYVLYGSDNLLSNKLTDLLNTSSIHNAIVKSKIEQTFGNFLISKNKTDYTKFKELVNNITNDLIIYGGYYIEVLKNKGGGFTFNHIDYSTIRVDKELKNNKPIKAYFSSDWSLYKKSGFEIENEYDIVYNIDENNIKELPNKFLFSYFKYNSNYNYYSICDYFAAINNIDVDSLISQYFKDNLMNGFVGGTIFSFKSYPSDEEQLAIKESIEDEFCGVNMNNKPVVTFSPDAESAPTITPIPSNDSDDKFTNLINSVQQSILTAHRVTNPLLVGIKTEGQLGGNQELINSQNLYYNTVINQYQQSIIFGLKQLFQLNDIDTEELTFENNQPISFQYSENIMKEILTKDEMREVIGYEPLDKRKRRNKSIAEIVGGVGITNILAIITNPALNDNQKINMLVLMYDIEIEDAEMIVLDKNMKVIDKIEEIKNNL